MSSGESFVTVKDLCGWNVLPLFILLYMWILKFSSMNQMNNTAAFQRGKESQTFRPGSSLCQLLTGWDKCTGTGAVLLIHFLLVSTPDAMELAELPHFTIDTVHTANPHPNSLLYWCYQVFSCGNHQPKIFFEIPDVSAASCCLHREAAEMSGISKKIFGWWFSQKNPEWCNPAGQASSTMSSVLCNVMKDYNTQYCSFTSTLFLLLMWWSWQKSLTSPLTQVTMVLGNVLCHAVTMSMVKWGFSASSTTSGVETGWRRMSNTVYYNLSLQYTAHLIGQKNTVVT